jgi:parallel beta-helix repeat protein
MNTRLPLLLLLVLSLKLANAATYYVDSSVGNDTWSGQQAAPLGVPATDGPWQSLAKVSASVLAPGDNVLLKCGETWRETLTLKNSGTAADPITIGAYPSGCADKPIISGATPIPAHNWIPDTGNIYKSSSAIYLLSSTIDLITFGTFENGLGNWAKWSPQNNATMNLTNSCAEANNTCMSFTSGSGYSLAISNNFAIQGKQSYTATFTMKSPAGVPVRAILRRGAAPWEAVGLNTSITGTGTWQTLTLPFTATTSLANARLDFEVPPGRNIGLDNVKITSAITNVAGVFDSGKSINVAHHPNRGYDPQKPDSLYYAIAENADQIGLAYGTTGSSYLTTGLDLAASVHPAITAGTGVRIRTNAWTINDRKIAAVSGTRLYFDSPTTYPIKKDWGYFLYGQRWMLDEPGEWHYDPATKTVHVWMADSAAPGNRVSIGQRALGIEASNLSHIRIDGLAIQNVDTGIRLQKATDIVMRNMSISDTLGLGIDAPLSTDSGVENSQITRTTGDAISTGGSAIRFHAYDNLIMDSSIQSRNGLLTGLPGPAKAAIQAGRSAIIRGNRIYGAGYIGIWPLGNSLISDNHIENTCLVLDDCGAIDMGGQNNNSTIENNTMLHVVGGLPGKPANIRTQAQGIYLDDLTSGVTVRGNTVVDADNGIQIHNAANNRIENNTLYGNRRHHIWLQEGSKVVSSEGDIHDNLVLGNRFFSTSATPAIRQETSLPKTNTDRFANYDSNLYFTFLWPNISSESWPGGAALYTLPEWQAAVTSTGLPRNLDPTASEVNGASLGYATFRILGGNIVPNGNLSSGTTGWRYWNQTAPYGQMVLEACTPASQCLRYTAGASESLLHSPNFSVQQDQWYKISFDIKTGTEGQTVYVVTRRGGGGSNGYESLMGASFKLAGSANLQRYSYLFKAVKTVNAQDPVTLDLGARVDFQGILPGQTVSVANLEIVPISAVDATLRSHILINPTGETLNLDCPDGTDAPSCSEYVRFTDSQSITWPYAVPPHGSEIIYSRDSSLTDGDGDGIPDYQDICNSTPALQAVNAAGCALGQR